jgi:flagellar motor switch protein FliG
MLRQSTLRCTTILLEKKFQGNEIDLTHVNTKDQVADILCKMKKWQPSTLILSIEKHV